MAPRDINSNNSLDSDAKGGPQDRRYIPRWEVSSKILYQLHDDIDIQEGRTQDLSCVGTCLHSEKDLLANKKVKLTIYLSEDTTIQVDGHILWTKKTPKGNFAGILFKDIKPEMQDLILDYAFEINKDDLVKHWFKGWDTNR